MFNRLSFGRPARGALAVLACAMMLAGCACWMSIGIMVMRKMINFDF